MKQNIKSIGEIELDEVELREIALHYIKEDRKLIFLAIHKYLKSLHQFELKKVATSLDAGGRMVAKCQVESLGAALTKPVIVSTAGGKKLKVGGHKKPNQGFYTVLMTILQEAYKKDRKKQLDAAKVYEDMRFELPNLEWRNFTIYASDKRRQSSSGYVYDGKKKLIRATRAS